jgi:hypothetical protein
MGRLRAVAPTPPVGEHDQLWLCELGCVELASHLEAVRIALGLPVTAQTTASLHSEGVSRAVELQAYEDVRGRLHDAGVTLGDTGREALEQQRQVTELSLDLLTDWDTYCIVRLIWTLSAQQWLAQVDPLAFGYVGTCFVVSHRTGAALLPTYRERAAGPLAHDPRAPAILARVTELLARFRQGMVGYTPVQPPNVEVDAGTLIAG